MGRKRSAERTEFLRDVMVTALEGGVGYWSVADDIVRSDTWETGNPYYVSYTLYCVDTDDPFGQAIGECGLSTHENPIEKCPGHVVDIDKVAHAFTILADKTKDADALMLNDEYRKHILKVSRENDAGEIDAGDADNIVQVAVLGSAIYG